MSLLLQEHQMDRKKRLRQNRERRFDPYYREIGHSQVDPCVYCGTISSGYDHIPPLIIVEMLEETAILTRNLRKYPCCHECNSVLGRAPLRTLDQRRLYLIEHYEEKYDHWLRMPRWDEEEIAELGPNLARDIQGHSKFSNFIKRRLSVLYKSSNQDWEQY